MTPEAGLEGLANRVKGMKPSQPQPNVHVVRQVRRSSAECRKANGSNETQIVNLDYYRPVAMEQFPSVSTGERDLVVGIYESAADDGCMESRYGPAKKHGPWDRVVVFNAVRSFGATPAPPSPQKGDDLSIGEWQTWVIESGPANKWRMHELRRGSYVRCGFRHGLENGSLAFITCKDAQKLHVEAEKAAPADGGVSRHTAVEQAFARLIAEYNSENSDLAARLVADKTTAPAWGRCGALGCCASY